jgi:hypothetical protein
MSKWDVAALAVVVGWLANDGYRLVRLIVRNAIKRAQGE